MLPVKQKNLGLGLTSVSRIAAASYVAGTIDCMQLVLEQLAYGEYANVYLENEDLQDAYKL